jgi:phage baseplate assembly protein W
MSFDLKIINGDISAGPDGIVNIVTGNAKLKQDILKILLTDIGSNQYHQKYGSYIGRLNIGDVVDQRLIELDIENSARNAIKNLMAMQRVQSKRQELSSGEVIEDITNVSVQRDNSDPRLYNIVVSVLTREITELTTSLAIKIA